MVKTYKKQRGDKKKASYKPLYCIIFAFLMLNLVGISLISAMEIDNSGTYYEETKTMEIKNLFGLGSPIANITLMSPLNHYVMRGEERLVAWYDIENYDDYDGNEVFDVIETFNIKQNMKPKEKNIQFKKQIINYEEVPKYEVVCNPFQDINETFNQNCSQVQNGTTIKETIEWQSFNKNNLLVAGNYTIGLFTEVEAEENIEWIPTMYGIRISEWAGWTESMTIGMTRYYYFNDSTEELHGVYNITQDGGSFNNSNGAGCLYGGCMGADGVNFPVLPGSSDTDISDGVKAFSFWVYAYAVADATLLDRETNRIYWGIGGVGDMYTVNLVHAGTGLGVSIDPGYWAMITAQSFANGTIEIWFNNSKVYSVDYTGTTSTGDWNMGSKYTLGSDRMYGYFDEMSLFNRTLNATEISDLWNSGNGITYSPPASVTTTTLNTPPDLNNSRNITNTFNCSASATSVDLTNISLYHNASGTYGLNETTVVTGSSNETTWAISLPQQNTSWSCSAGDVNGLETFATANRTIFVDSLYPTVLVNAGNGTQASGSLLTNHTINFTATDIHLDTCIIDYNSINATIPCSTGVLATHNFTMLVDGYNATIYTTDEIGNMNTTEVTWNFTTLEANSLYNTTSYETKSETFKQNITTTGTLTSPKFIINGVEKTATATLTGTNYELNTTFDIPLTIGSKGFFFNYTIGGVESSTTNHSQNISATNLNICNGTLNVTFMNFTFADETNLSKLYTGTIPLVTWDYYLGTGNITKSFTFTNNTGNAEFDFCASPNQTFTTNYTLQYAESVGNYPQRIIEASPTLTNTTTLKTLYLLENGDGQYVTFQLINPAEQALQNVHATANRTISSINTIVGEGNTDASGGVTFFLNPDFSHTMLFTHPSYNDFTTTFFPTQTSYTIQLGNTTTSFVGTDYTKGVSYSISPNFGTLLNDTTYSFNLTLSSAFWTITSFGFTLFNSTNDSIGYASSATDGGTVNLNLDTGANSHIGMNYFWVVNGTYVNGTTQGWLIYFDTENNEWSISRFFTDASTYLNAGLFMSPGATQQNINFTMAIITFIIIFMIIGVMSFKYGIINPVPIAALLLGLVFFFDVGLDFMDNLIPQTIVPHLPTIIMFTIFIAIFWRENAK